MPLSKEQKRVIHKKGGDAKKLQPVSAGHMSYHHFFFDGRDDNYFVKAHDPAFFTDPVHESDAKHHLKKEAAYYEHLRKSGFRHIPAYSDHAGSMLLLKALHAKDGWHWEMPADLSLQDKYVQDILKVLKKLESIPLYIYDKNDLPAMSIFEKDGWLAIGPKEAAKLVASGQKKWANVMRTDTFTEAQKLAEEIVNVKEPAPLKLNTNILNHHDARQSNIAWHPKHGVAIVDWSWAGPGVENGDTTMFLIDLHKRGYRLPESASQYFDKDYALRVMGYWLKRSSAEPRRKNDTVRYHQFVSAVKAHDLIKQLAR